MQIFEQAYGANPVPPPVAHDEAPTPHNEPNNDRNATDLELQQIYNNFDTYIQAQFLLPNRDNLSPEERMREIVFQYSLDRNRATRFEQLESPQTHLGRFLSLFPGVHQTMQGIHHHIYDHAPIVEHAANWMREGAYGMAIGTGARLLITHGAQFFNITGGPAVWFASGAVGAISGAAMGFRRGGERYVTKNFGAEKLIDDLHINDLLEQNRLYRQQAHHEYSQVAPGVPVGTPPGDSMYADSRNAEGRAIAGLETPEEYYRQVASALTQLKSLEHDNMIRGTHQQKSELADDMAALEAILETQAYMKAIVAHNEEPGAAPTFFTGPTPADTPNFAALDTLWMGLQEHRGVHTLAMFFDKDVQKRTDDLMGVWHKEARGASRKAAFVGAVAGATMSCVFTHFFGNAERVLKGFGDGATDPNQAITAATHNKDFSTLSRLLESQSNLAHGGVTLDGQTTQAINTLLHNYNLMPINHYDTMIINPTTGIASPHNYLLDMIHNLNDNPTSGLDAEHAQRALYNVLSHWDNAPSAIADPTGPPFIPSLDSWHQTLMDWSQNHDGASQLADPNSAIMTDARQIFLDKMRALGHLAMEPTIESAFNAQAGNGMIGGIADFGTAAGWATGEAVGQFATPNQTLNTEVKPITEAEANAVGKPLPAVGQYWEARHGVQNYNGNAIFRFGVDPNIALIFEVTNVNGQYATIAMKGYKELKPAGGKLPATILGKRPKGWTGGTEFKVQISEMVRQTGFQIDKNVAEKKPDATTPGATPPTPAEVIKGLMGKSFTQKLTISGDGSPALPYKVDGTPTETKLSGGMPILVSNITDPAAALIISGLKTAAPPAPENINLKFKINAPVLDAGVIKLSVDIT